jgi:RNA polymerase sigma-70 factor, ECF subfamily
MTSAPSDFTKTYGRFLPPIRAKCRRMLGRSALADEVAQEAFTRLWQSGLPLDPAESSRTIMAWLYVTSTRLATDLIREGRQRPLDELTDDTPACGVSPAGVAEARSAIAALWKIMPADEMEVALLLRVDGLSQPEAAALLGVSERTIRRLLERFDERSRELRKETVE